MPLGIQGFSDSLRSRTLWGGTASGNGLGSYDRVANAVRALADDPRLLTPLAAAWHARTFDDGLGRAFLLLAALRYRALEAPDHPMAFELLSDAEAPDLEARLLEALADPHLPAVLAQHTVRGNDPGRALAWGLVAAILVLKHRSFDLVELGSIAGLSLVVDRTSIPFRFGVNRLSGFDLVSPELRLGLDPNPVDVHDEATARWMTACIWPGQPERLDRLRSTLALYRHPWRGDAPAPHITRHVFGTAETAPALDAALAASNARPCIVFETTLVRPSLDRHQRSLHDDALWSFLEQHPQRIWAVMEPAKNATPPHESANTVFPSSSYPMNLTVYFVRSGSRHAVTLAQTGFHTAECMLLPGAVKLFRERWDP